MTCQAWLVTRKVWSRGMCSWLEWSRSTGYSQQIAGGLALHVLGTSRVTLRACLYSSRRDLLMFDLHGASHDLLRRSCKKWRRECAGAGNNSAVVWYKWDLKWWNLPFFKRWQGWKVLKWRIRKWVVNMFCCGMLMFSNLYGGMWLRREGKVRGGTVVMKREEPFRVRGPDLEWGA